MSKGNHMTTSGRSGQPRRGRGEVVTLPTADYVHVHSNDPPVEYKATTTVSSNDYFIMVEGEGGSMREMIAAVQHAIWSHWMKYMFTQSVYDELGNWTMPSGKVERWHRQMETDYSDLTERERSSDREQADKVLAAMEKVTQ